MEQNQVARWLEQTAAGVTMGGKARSAMQIIGSHPRLASYGSLKELAEASGVSPSTFTRLAQALGFSGWPDLQSEVRTRYLVALTPTELSDERLSSNADPVRNALSRDVANLAYFARTINVEAINEAAECIATGRSVYLLGLGSYGGLSHILNHWAQLYGYDTTPLSGVAQIVNVLSQMGDEDVLVVFGFWRMYAYAFQAIRSAHEAGVKVIFVTDNRLQELAEIVHITIEVPTEGVGSAPSMTTAIAVVQAILAKLATIDPERSRERLKCAEKQWEKFGLLHKYQAD